MLRKTRFHEDLGTWKGQFPTDIAPKTHTPDNYPWDNCPRRTIIPPPPPPDNALPGTISPGKLQPNPNQPTPTRACGGWGERRPVVRGGGG